MSHFAETILPRVSRSFALSIEALPEGLREIVRTAYLLCRVVDTVEDGRGIDRPGRERLFDEFDALVKADAAPDGARFEALAAELSVDAAAKELCRGTTEIFAELHRLPSPARQRIRETLLEMSRGMRDYTRRVDEVGGIRIRDLADLERYCYFVAGTVGNLLTAVFEEEVPSLDDATRAALRARAVPFGIGLQLVNIVKDVAEDLVRGDCFLPMDLMEHRGLTAERLLDPTVRPAALRVVREVTQQARLHLRQAVEYTLLWPVPEAAAIRLFCAVPLALALSTLDAVEKGQDTLRSGRTPKVSRTATLQILERARALAGAEGLAQLLAALEPRESRPLARAR